MSVSLCKTLTTGEILIVHVEFSSGSVRGRYASGGYGYRYIPAYQQGQFVLVKRSKLPY